MREELQELVGQRDALEQLARQLRAALGVEPLVVADELADLLELLVLQPPHELGGDLLAGVVSVTPWRIHCHTCEREISAVAASSMRLKIARRAVAAQPGRDVLDADVDVRCAGPSSVIVARPRSASSSSSARRRARRRAGLSIWFGRSPSTASNTSIATGTEIGVRDPRAVEAVAGLALLVVATCSKAALVDLRVLAARDERRHAAHRVRAAAVAGLHQAARCRRA